MPVYDGELFRPPAPLARLDLRNPTTGAAVRNVPMLLDTGADVTLVPESSLTSLGLSLQSAPSYELVGFDGMHSSARAVDLQLVLLERSFAGRFLTIDQSWGILGRNVLNSLPLLLNGPEGTWGLARLSGKP